MRSHCIFALLTCCSVLGGCGGDETSTTGGGTTTGTPGENANTLTVKTGEFQAPAGDSFECFYTDTVTDRELSTTHSTGTQGPGGHHVTIYYTDTPRKAQHHPCTDAEMASWHQVGAAANDTAGAEGLVALPPGLAIKIAAGKQIVVQAHYINTTGAPETVNDSITLHTVDPKDVKAYANYYVMNNDQFEVPPQGTLTSQRTCTMNTDLDTVVLLGHMHEAGRHFKLERAEAEGKPYETLYDHDWEEQYTSHPPVLTYTMEKPLHFAKGTKLRTTCTWDNSKSDPTIFPNEMCIAFMYYFPDAGEQYCTLDPEPAAP